MNKHQNLCVFCKEHEIKKEVEELFREDYRDPYIRPFGGYFITKLNLITNYKIERAKSRIEFDLLNKMFLHRKLNLFYNQGIMLIEDGK